MSTPRVMAALEEAEFELMDVLARHLVGDWGDVREEEKLLNELAVVHDERITSAYLLPTGTEIWITTTGNRQLTWLKLPGQDDSEDNSCRLLKITPRLTPSPSLHTQPQIGSLIASARCLLAYRRPASGGEPGLSVRPG